MQVLFEIQQIVVDLIWGIQQLNQPRYQKYKDKILPLLNEILEILKEK
jgi:hypothetical protein